MRGTETSEWWWRPAVDSRESQPTVGAFTVVRSCLYARWPGRTMKPDVDVERGWWKRRVVFLGSDGHRWVFGV